MKENEKVLKCSRCGQYFTGVISNDITLNGETIGKIVNFNVVCEYCLDENDK